jgi:hypothetical protein
VNQFELEKLWVGVHGIRGVAFRFRDAVRVKAGEHAGDTGSVVALLAVVPTPLYVVELSLSGMSLTLPQSDLERAG